MEFSGLAEELHGAGGSSVVKGSLISRLLYKACPRCRGDLLLDSESTQNANTVFYECLQCGRSFSAELRNKPPLAA
jgi:DNA-directed RNA polymerase subunit RPC12/RpoP